MLVVGKHKPHADAVSRKSLGQAGEIARQHGAQRCNIQTLAARTCKNTGAIGVPILVYVKGNRGAPL